MDVRLNCLEIIVTGEHPNNYKIIGTPQAFNKTGEIRKWLLAFGRHNNPSEEQDHSNIKQLQKRVFLAISTSLQLQNDIGFHLTASVV
jgi:hypothetical protein